MRSLFWKRTQFKKHGTPPQLEQGGSLVYLIDINKYMYFGITKSQQNPVKEVPQNPTQQKEEQKSQTNQINFSISKIPNTSINFSLGSSLNSTANCHETVHVLDPTTYEWTEHTCQGRLPVKRNYQISWYEAPHLFIYGGLTPDKKVLNDICVLNVETFTWKRLFWLEGPTGRLHSQIVDMGDRQYLIGGTSMPENLLFNDIWEFSFQGIIWSATSLQLPGITWKQINLEDNQVFMPLKAFAAAQLNENQIYIFGGYNQKKQCTDTSLIIDANSKKVQEIITRGQRPSPRSFHKMIFIKENILCIFGGVSCPEDAIKSLTATVLNDLYILNINEAYWSRPNVGGYIPTPRYSYCMASNQSQMAAEIILFGGKTLDSHGDKYIYTLYENSNDNQLWGERDDQAKLKFEAYTEALKKQKNQDIQNVPMITLELSQAQKMIIEQQRMIGEQQSILKKLRETNEETQRRHETYQDQIIQIKEDFQVKTKELRQENIEKSQRNHQNQEFMEQIKLLLGNERKKRKQLQIQSFALQQALRCAQNFIITVDSVYNQGVHADALQGIINDEALKKIEQLKIEHKNLLISFRDQFDGFLQREKSLQTQMRAKKKSLLPNINISEYWKTLMTPDQKTIFTQQL